MKAFSPRWSGDYCEGGGLLNAGRADVTIKGIK